MTIKEMRLARNMTQLELAYQAGITPATLIRVEQGKPCFQSTLRAIAGALNVDISEITEAHVVQRIRG